jgi:HEAT repeat protein
MSDAAAHGLGANGSPRTIATLVAALQTPQQETRSDADVRGAIVGALQKIGAPAVAPILAWVREPVPKKYDLGAAKEVLKGIGAPAVQPLIEALGDPNDDVRVFAAETLSANGDAAAVNALMRALKEGSRPVRLAAVDALAALPDPRVADALNAALHDAESQVRLAAVKALVRIGRPPSIDAIRAVLLSADPDLQMTRVVEVLIGRGDAGIKALCDMVRNAPRAAPAQVRAAVAIELGKISDPRATDALIKTLGDGDDKEVRAACAAALGGKRDRKVVDALIKALGDREGYVVITAGRVLARIRDRRAIEPLVAAYRRTENDADVHYEIGAALLRLDVYDPGHYVPGKW